MPQPDRQRIIDCLWSTDLPGSSRVWAILDGARDNRIYSALTSLRPEHYCLYRGNLPGELRLTAPYLVRLEPQDRLVQHLLDWGWGNSWGIFLRAEEGGEGLRSHFRRFLIVQDEQGRRLIFRYYDPRVLRIYLPTCLPQELKTVFGPVRRYLLEGEDPMTMAQNEFDGSKLITREVALEGAGNPIPVPAA